MLVLALAGCNQAAPEESSSQSDLKIVEQVQIDQNGAEVKAAAGAAPADPQVPADAVTASGSGLDPDISADYADLQVDRVAKARHLSADEVRALVRDNTKGRVLGFMGEPRVNVLQLNLALDQKHPARIG